MRGLSLTAEDLTDLMAGNSINVEDENGYELLVTPDQAPSTTVGPYPRDAVEFEETDEGVMWFINEDGGVYPYPAHRQERDFPNDDHVAYPDGEAARDAVDLSEVDVSVNVSVVIGCRSKWEYRMGKPCGIPLATWLNDMGQDGWELCLNDWGVSVFKREVRA